MRKGPQGRIVQVAPKRGGAPIGRGTKARIVGVLTNQRPIETRIITTGWNYPEPQGRSVTILTRTDHLERVSHGLNRILNIEED